MKLQPASRKEVSRISVGVLICDGLMVVGLFLLSQFGLGEFHLLKILLGAACGSLISIGNFVILCLTVQSALEIEKERKRRARFQRSYNLRLMIQAIWIVGAFFLRDKVHFIAAAAPLFFPNVWLIYLQLSGRLNGVAPINVRASKTEEDSQQ